MKFHKVCRKIKLNLFAIYNVFVYALRQASTSRWKLQYSGFIIKKLGNYPPCQLCTHH